MLQDNNDDSVFVRLPAPAFEITTQTVKVSRSSIVTVE